MAFRNARPLSAPFTLVVILTLACQTVTRAWRATPPLTPTATPLRPSARTSGPAVPAATLVPASPVPRATATALPTATLRPTPAPLHLEIFEELWRIVWEEYLYPDFNGVDWDAVRAEFRERVEAGLTDREFYAAMDEMIARLGDEHSVFLSPQQAAEEDARYAGESDYVGIGVLVAAVPERGRAVILLTFPGSPAERAGLAPRDGILAVDGQPILDEDGFLRDIVRGPEGTPVVLTVQTPGQQPRTLTLMRRRVTGAVPVPRRVLETPMGKRVGYLLLITFSDSTIDDQVGEALETLAEVGPLSGLILDNRQNEGGADTVLRGTLAYFTDGVLGYFVNRIERRPLHVVGRDVHGSQSLPLVTLIGPDTVSYGEVFAGVLQDLGRGYLIGAPTLGNVETLWGYDFSDGSRAWIAHDSFQPLNAVDQDWEQDGVRPDLWIPSNWDEFTLETDPAVHAALAYLDGPGLLGEHPAAGMAERVREPLSPVSWLW